MTETGQKDNQSLEIKSSDNKSLIYVADPMCSWCYGFAPVIHKINQTFGTEAPLEIVVGGLRPWTTEPWDDATREKIGEHWSHVAKATGQTFNMDRLNDAAFIYDTEPACRAVACVRAISAEHSLPYLETVHKAFYQEGKDPKSLDVLSQCAAQVGLPQAAFEERFQSDVAIQDVTQHFQITRQWGITGYPAVLLRTDDTLSMLTMGYQGYDALAPVLEAWLTGQ